MSHSPGCYLAAFLLGLTPAFASAQLTEKVIVTGARAPQPLVEILADVTVINEDEIARSGTQSLAQLLQRQRGIEITANGGPGATSGIFIRGANTGHTLFLVDGLRVSSSSSGATSLEAIPLDQVERIEILRGPASSLYGADAVGGVIQVFMKRGAGPTSATLTAGYGTRSTSHLNAGVAGSTGALRFSANVGAIESDGFNSIVNPSNFGYNPDRDGYSTRNIGGSIGFDWAQGQSLELRGMRNRLDSQSDGGPDFDDRTITTLQTWSLSSRNQISASWTSTLLAGIGRDDSVSKAAFGDSLFETRQRQYQWQNDLAISVGTLSLVLERREERLETNNAFAVTSRDTDSVGLVYRTQKDGWALQANGRRDDSSQYNARNTGGVLVGYRFSPAWRGTAGYATAFKAPSFNDLYFPGFSNPNLRPEKARNAELGMAWAPAPGSELRATVYRNRVDDLIVFGCDENFNCHPGNVYKATLEGVSLGLDTKWGNTQLKASLDLQRPKNDATGALLPQRARRHGVVQVIQAWGPLRAGVEWIASSARYDNAANTIGLAGYSLLNLTLDWQLSTRWTAFVRGNNVFDRDYRIAADYSNGGAAVLAGVRGSF
ncbi:MAG: TonB-dependent receptor [Usitatibacter sp.]